MRGRLIVAITNDWSSAICHPDPASAEKGTIFVKLFNTQPVNPYNRLILSDAGLMHYFFSITAVKPPKGNILIFNLSPEVNSLRA